MFGSTVLDVAIGMVFIYLLLSLVCSAANELMEGLLKNRATDLEKGIRELLGTGGGPTSAFVKKIYDHPLVSALYKGTYASYQEHEKSNVLWRAAKTAASFGPTLPSYIPAKNFALAVMDCVLPAQAASPPATNLSGAAGSTQTGAATAQPAGAPAVNPVTALREAVSKLPDAHLRDALLVLIDAAGNDMSQVRNNIETWFNTAMDRVSGWYKRRVQVFILLIGLGVAFGLNVDSISLVRHLSTDKSQREALVASAQGYATTPGSTTCDAECRIKKNLDQIRGLQLPIGWSLESPGANDTERKWPGLSISGWVSQVGSHLWGWILTALAISLGAPFWFDVLNKFVVVRSTVKPHEKSPEEKSKA